MSDIFLFAHGGSGNHGCEAIVRSTVKLLENQRITLISSKPEEDKKYGLDKLCNIIKDTSSIIKKNNIDFLKAYLLLKIKNDYVAMDKLWYKEAFSHIKRGDVTLSIGGDNYCYADVNKYLMLHSMLKKKGAKTVLWGCSVEPDVINNKKVTLDLASYDLITARETISYSALKEINPNTILVADSAFGMGMKEAELPDRFLEKNTVGINLSPMAIEREQVSGMTCENYIALVDYILDKTDMNVAFIPHVVWKDGDDRIPLRKLYSLYKNTKRVCMVEDHDCMELKYIISKCRFFIGARTHATIAAYSSNIPTLVLGYSVKARGIAKDLFGKEEGYVIPVQSLMKKEQLTDAFIALMKNEENIKKMLKETIAAYGGKVKKGVEALAGL